MWWWLFYFLHTKLSLGGGSGPSGHGHHSGHWAVSLSLSGFIGWYGAAAFTFMGTFLKSRANFTLFLFPSFLFPVSFLSPTSLLYLLCLFLSLSQTKHSQWLEYPRLFRVFAQAVLSFWASFSQVFPVANPHLPLQLHLNCISSLKPLPSGPPLCSQRSQAYLSHGT